MVVTSKYGVSLEVSKRSEFIQRTTKKGGIIGRNKRYSEQLIKHK